MRNPQPHGTAGHCEHVSLLRQVGTVLRKDARRWAPLVAAAVGAFALWRVRAGQPPSGTSDFLGWGITVSLVWGLVGLVIMDDSPAGDRAFWRTRPVSPLATFIAKSAFLFILLVLLPSAVQTHWLASAWPRAWRDFWFGSIVTQSALLGLAILAASLSGRWGRYLAFGGVLFVTAVTFFEAWVISILPSIPRLSVAALLATALAGWQYHRPQTGLIAACGLAAIAAIPFSPFHSAPPLVELLVPRPDPVTAYAQSDSVVISVQTLGLHHDRNATVYRARPALWGELTADAPGNVFAVFREVEGRLTPSGRIRSFHPFDESGSDVEFPGERFGYRNLTTPARDRGWPSHSQFDLLWAEAEEIDQRLAASNGFTVRVAADLYEPTIRGRLALRPSAVLRTRRATFEVESVERLPGRLLIRISMVGPSWNFFWEESRRLPILLVNPVREEFLTGTPGLGQQFTMGLVPSLQWLGSHQTIRFDLPADLPDGWLDGAELQVLGMDYVGSVERTLTREVEEWPRWGRQIAVDWVPPDSKTEK